MSGLYIHIPFCRKACIYCDFHFSTNLENKQRLVDAICKEITLKKNYLAVNTLQSVYFGGGTPSILSPSELEKIVDTIHAHYKLEQGAEITLELNPEDANKEYLTSLRQLGINRLSIGLQSFNDAELQWMNRIHNPKQSIQCIETAKHAGFENISIDLIYGSRFQTIPSWKETLQRAFSLDIKHISAYNLTVESKTKLAHLIKEKKEQITDAEMSSVQFDVLMEEAERNNFIHYEISNLCKDGYMAVHNSNYWKGASYIGTGPSAHSYNGSTRQFNVKSNAAYSKAIETGGNCFEEEILSPNNKYNEYILTRLRTQWGCDLPEIDKVFGKKYLDHFLKQAEKHKDHLHIRQKTVTLTRQGKHFADGIASDLFYIT